MERGENCHFFSLTSLQIGDLQSYLSRLSLFLAPESNKFFILVDNRPWLIEQESRSAHLWQLMVTKSRLSPFANTRASRAGKNFGKRRDLKSRSSSNPSEARKLKRWFSVIDAALHQKKALLPVKKLRASVLLNSELHRTLYGFIVFEVSWANVRGINYLNELQTDTSMAVEAKLMKRWEFDSIGQASSCICSWFSGTSYEHYLLQEYLDKISHIGEVFYDARDDLSKIDSTSDGENICTDDESSKSESCHGSISEFRVYPAGMEYGTSLLHTPPPPSGPYKRRKIMKCTSTESDVDTVKEEAEGEIFNSPRHSATSISNHSFKRGNAAIAFEATLYKDVLILFRFNDRDLPFKLKEIIMSDLRLLTLLESGLPSWVIFLQSYPLFCQFYRPWMCPLARALYLLISVVTVVIGFYDLYKNVPVLKATASRLCGPLFDWIETWEMISRIKYLGTMLFLHNFEKAVKWSLMITRATKSLFSVITKPMAGPVLELAELFLPFWLICLQTGESFGSVIWIVIATTCSLAAELVQIVLYPVWFALSSVWSMAVFIIYPLFWAIWELLIAPIRLVLASASCIAWVCSYFFDFVWEIWLTASSIFQFASTSESTVGTYEISIWRSLWSDLFSQVFRAIRSIVNGFVAFFIACNRHRLSIYNHIQDFLLRTSCLARGRRCSDSSYSRKKDVAQKSLGARRKFQSNSRPNEQMLENVHRRGNRSNWEDFDG
ncbi:G1/S-specific cyclin-E protein [Tasmannia lanceolata]|uniref:G1/S-specific cyclin-E protein n=1 Tax=Tasmannia lanceolata TaxID=3420 RepID=UPI0040641547